VLVVAGIAVTHAVSVWPLIEFLHPGGGANRDLAAAVLFASPLLYLPLARIPWLLRNRPAFSRTLTVAAGVAVPLLASAFRFVWSDDVNRDQVLRWSLGAPAAVAAAVVLALPRLYPDMPLRARHGLAAIVVLAWLTLVVGAAFARATAPVVGAVLQVVWLGLFAWTSIQLGQVRAFNVLTALIALRVLAVYFEVFGSLLSTGVGLITGGALT